MPVVNLTAAADSFVDQARPNNNFNGLGYLIVGEMYSESPEPQAQGVCRAWLRFDVSSIPAAAAINSASLKLNVFYVVDDYGSKIYEVQRSSDNAWPETAITWNNAPEDDLAGVISYFDVSPLTAIYAIDVKSQLEAALASGDLSLRVKKEEENGMGINVTSREWATGKPVLTVDYTAARRRARMIVTVD